MIVKDPDEVNEDCMILQIVSVYSCRLLLLGHLANTMLINMDEACKALRCLKVTHCRPRTKVKTIPCQD